MFEDDDLYEWYTNSRPNSHPNLYLNCVKFLLELYILSIFIVLYFIILIEIILRVCILFHYLLIVICQWCKTNVVYDK